ncbi:MAG: bifunctional UDP-4-keto-pentose/UDP-xylose synthase [Holosporaceae bacterium]|jgi:nucleoside-diphosphate-sugar epimerase|nr:bifunctional UDP-4-keto-pentose/UDP-xylose synthase [Holosporaceae bacterium]
MNLLIVGAGGFIGSHLSEKILQDRRNWRITAVDLQKDNIAHLLEDDNFHFYRLDLLKDFDELERLLKDCDVLLPLAAIASPAVYVEDPLRVFELDFEANLRLVRWAVKYRKRVVFPSTSEVYGMCADDEFFEDSSPCVVGPVCKQRWIYSCSKQMLDRVIYAHGERDGTDYTLFRPFNFIGPRLDNIRNPNNGGSRVVTQFLSNILHGRDIRLVDGGSQQRSFTDIADGVAALMKILENKNDCATRQIFNIGNPHNRISIKELAQRLVALAGEYDQLREAVKKIKVTDTSAEEYYGVGYQDVSWRVPSIKKAETLLNWRPAITIDASLRKIMDFYFG